MTNPDQLYTTYIKTTPEKLWAAITTPEFARQYWGGNVNLSDWKQGSQWSHENPDNKNVFVQGKVLESTPPKRLALSWFAPSNEANVSTVTFDIEQLPDNTVRLIVTHGGFQQDTTMATSVAGGWPLVLSSLKSYLESGKAIDIMAIKGACGTPKAA